ncbi:hypothetical protein F4781DRAFT_431032 [Annulohypoxylon bovei var. microspora]|nr:hypothetical protein F4781DRAFT_431032 [Annulohypoxylon bovei var. microspora]
MLESIGKDGYARFYPLIPRYPSDYFDSTDVIWKFAAYQRSSSTIRRLYTHLISISTLTDGYRVNSFLKQIRLGNTSEYEQLAVIGAVDQALYHLTRPTEERWREQHRSIAEAVAGANGENMYSKEWVDESGEAKIAESLLSGAIIIGDSNLVKFFLETSALRIAYVIRDEINGQMPVT